mmetsp:Transcript_7116/g.17669  ORF Transcript_7116/g.17669 Transcript_7116/m.17669 type:complete len:86 (+) Transcript_7116:343-600(+)
MARQCKIIPSVSIPNGYIDVSGAVIILHWGVRNTPKGLIAIAVDGGAESTLLHAPTAYTSAEIAVQPTDGSILSIEVDGRAPGWS